MLAGLPSLFHYVVDEVTARRRPDSLPIVLYHMLGDVANAAESSLSDYFTLTLDEPYLQNSSRGTPYQEWAELNNESFEKVDRCMRRLLPAVWHWYEETMGTRSDPDEGVKDAWNWLHTVIETYACCVAIRDEPTLILSAVNLGDWIDRERRFMRLWSEWPSRRRSAVPSIVVKSIRDISDRSVLLELQRVGRGRLEELRQANSRFAAWLCANYSVEEITAPHEGTLSDSWMGDRAL